MIEKIDIVLFGATGFTGSHVVLTMVKFSKSKNHHFTWGVAGRSEEKIKMLLSDCEKQTGFSLDNVPIIVADVKNEQTLQEMALKARIVVNCCGPFHFYGKPVIKACVEEGTHHLDVSGEVHFMENIEKEYHQKAQEKKIYVISACGYESIPVDLGITFLQKKFRGTLNSVTAFMEYWEEDDEKIWGSAINSGTWKSLVCILANSKRWQLFPKQELHFEPKLKLRIIPHKSSVVHRWVLPLPAPDLYVAGRTQRYFYENHSKRPVQIQTYFVAKSFKYMIMLCVVCLIVLIIGRFACGQKLLLKYPEIFTFGYVNKETPNKERTGRSHMRTTLYGQGWENIPSGVDVQHSTPPNGVITARIEGRDPTYGVTAICLVLAAITLIEETDKIPPEGGVYPPGYVFANTSLIQKLKENAINFNILYDKVCI